MGLFSVTLQIMLLGEGLIMASYKGSAKKVSIRVWYRV